MLDWSKRASLTLPRPCSKRTFSQLYKEKCISEAVRVGSVNSFHLNNLWKATFFILCDVIFLMRLEGKFEVDHSWEWKGWTTGSGQCEIIRAKKSYFMSRIHLHGQCVIAFQWRNLISLASHSHLLISPRKSKIAQPRNSPHSKSCIAREPARLTLQESGRSSTRNKLFTLEITWMRFCAIFSLQWSIWINRQVITTWLARRIGS